MKNIFLYILLFIGFSGFAQESPENILEQANQLYVSEKYEEAVNLYLQLVNQGNESAELYFNLGNAFYKSNDAVHAILYYERALLLDPHDEDIAFNLRIANQYVVDNIEELPTPFFLRWRETVVNLYPVDTWATISIVSFLLFLVLFGLFLYSKSVGLKRFSFLLGIVIFIFSGFTYSFSYKQKKKLEQRDYAIVLCPRVTVKSSPSSTGTDLFLIHDGLKVQITDSLSNWKEVRLADGNQGWLNDSCIVKI